MTKQKIGVAPKPDFRTLRVHVTDGARRSAVDSQQFCSNKIVTAKFDAYSFIPKNLYQQFQQPVTLYFLLIAAIQLIPGLSPSTSWSTLVPLCFVLVLNGMKEGFDDWKRRLCDMQVNKRKVQILIGEDFLDGDWSTVIVGDILKVQIDEEFPADLVFLSSSDPQVMPGSVGLAYLETSNLDGETNLKLRNSFYKLAPLMFEGGDMSMSVFSGMIIKCEKPNNRLYHFEGSINLRGAGKMPVDESQVLLRGATLRNTEWVLGSVVFTGPDTKLMRNMVSAPRKMSSLEKHSNILVAVLFFILVLLCLALAIVENKWSLKNTGHYYLPNTYTWPEYAPGLAGVAVQILRFLILLNQFIPISMYVTLEIVKVVQCLFINWDHHMFYAHTQQYAQAQFSGLTEELGQVEYVLSDKTGTLTQNLMAFVECSIGGELYGSKECAEDVNNNGDHHEESCDYDQETKSVHSVCHDPALRELLNDTSSDKGKLCQAFFTHLSVCHTVIPRFQNDDESGDLRYESTSPDELALVQGAAECGFQLKWRNPEEIKVFFEGQGLKRFSILAVLEFTPERKRMSIICKEHKGRVKLFCKGADTVIFKRLTNSQDGVAAASLKHLEEFARAGYRTLCMAERELSLEEFDSWAARFRHASASLDEREEKLIAAAETIERDMVLLGIAAVEDKLQEGVPETVTLLSEAGIKLWVLTGDKLETAVSIGLSCNLLADSMHLFLLSESVTASVPQLLRTMLREAQNNYSVKLIAGSHHSDMATVIEGASVAVALEESNRLVFLELCRYCRAVVCCRVSPIQKAQVTRLLKHYGQAVTLAIGDGANDVGMIKAAQIGVGINGREGTSAVMASDYALAQFRFLSRLLLVHGRWSYKRNRDLVMYAFYKNTVFVMGNFYLSFFSAYSAQSLYVGFLISTYNLLWTSLPTLASAIFDKDVSDRTAENNPQLYIESHLEKKHQFLWNISCWILTGLWHSAVAFFFPWCIIRTSESHGESGGLSSLGAMVYTMCILIVNMKLAACTYRFTYVHIVLFCSSIVSWLLVLFFLSYADKWNVYWEDLNAVGTSLYKASNFWLLVALTPITACLPDVTISIFTKRSAPLNFQIMQEIESGWHDGAYVHGTPDFVGRVTELLGKRGSRCEFGGLTAQLEEAAAAKEALSVKTQENFQSDPDDTTESNLLPRRMTWREVVSDGEVEGIDHVNMLSRYGRRRSSGFHVATSHSAVANPIVETATPSNSDASSMEETDMSLLHRRKQDNSSADGMARKAPLSSTDKLTAQWDSFNAIWSTNLPIAPPQQQTVPRHAIGKNPGKLSDIPAVSSSSKASNKLQKSGTSKQNELSSKSSYILSSHEDALASSSLAPLPSSFSQRDDVAAAGGPPPTMQYQHFNTPDSHRQLVTTDYPSYWPGPREPSNTDFGDYFSGAGVTQLGNAVNYNMHSSKGSPMNVRILRSSDPKPAVSNVYSIDLTPADFFEPAQVWPVPPQFVQQRLHDVNQADYRGSYMARPPPITRMFIPPSPPRSSTPGPLENHERQRSTFEHYSQLTGGPSYHDYNAQQVRELSIGDPGSRRMPVQRGQEEPRRAYEQHLQPPTTSSSSSPSGSKDNYYVQRTRDPSTYFYGTNSGAASNTGEYYEQPISEDVGYSRPAFLGKQKLAMLDRQRVPSRPASAEALVCPRGQDQTSSSSDFHVQLEQRPSTSSGDSTHSQGQVRVVQPMQEIEKQPNTSEYPSAPEQRPSTSEESATHPQKQPAVHTARRQSKLTRSASGHTKHRMSADTPEIDTPSVFADYSHHGGRQTHAARKQNNLQTDNNMTTASPRQSGSPLGMQPSSSPRLEEGKKQDPDDIISRPTPSSSSSSPSVSIPTAISRDAIRAKITGSSPWASETPGNPPNYSPVMSSTSTTSPIQLPAGDQSIPGRLSRRTNLIEFEPH